jgi:hypothetical protein
MGHPDLLRVELIKSQALGMTNLFWVREFASLGICWNCRSLRFGRDDKGEGGASIKDSLVGWRDLLFLSNPAPLPRAVLARGLPK